MKTMKTLMIGMSLISSAAAMADGVSAANRLRAVADLQAQGKVHEANTAALTSIHELRNELRTGEVVRTIDTAITQLQDEKVVGNLKTKDSFAAGISALMGLISGSGSLKKSADADLTKVLVLNPEEISRFPYRVQSELRGLREQLLQYVDAHADQIIAIKALGAIYFQTAAKMIDDRQYVSSDDVKDVVDATTNFSFAGEQVVTACVKTSHEAYEKKSASSKGLEFGIFGLLSGDYSESHRLDEKGFAYLDQSCQSTVNSISVAPTEMSVWKVNLSELDRAVQQWARVAVLKMALSSMQDQPFPTFGNPAYR